MSQNNNIALVLPELGINQLNYTILKQISSLKDELNFVIFYERLTPSMANWPCVTLPFVEAHSFCGTIISFTLESANRILPLTTPVNRVFYIYDLEPLRGNLPFVLTSQVYRNKKLVIMTRSNEYSDFINNYANRRPTVVEDIDLNKMLEVVNE